MKNFSKLILTAIIALLTFVFAAVTAGAEIYSLSVDGYSDKNTGFTVRWQDGTNKTYNLYIPSTAEENVRVSYIADGVVKIDGKILSDGAKTDIFKNEGTYTLVEGNDTYTLNVYRMTLPTVFVATNGSKTPEGMTTLEWLRQNKEHKDKDGTVAIIDNDENMTVQYSGKLSQIKGRGNSTWTKYSKKPFNIKLDKKASIFGMDKNKSWCLLANCGDLSLSRNILAYNLANEMEIPYTSRQYSVDFYIDGEFQGVYTICEKVEINNGRIDITDLEEANEAANPDIDIEDCKRNCSNGNLNTNTAGFYKWVDIPNNPEDITGGYVLETEIQSRFANEISGFVTSRGVCIVIKSPEYASKAEVEYIREVYQKFEDAVYNEYGFNENNHYSELCDVDSLVKMYIANDLCLNQDAGNTSFYLVKDADKTDEEGNVTQSEFVAGPLWDYDNSLANMNDVTNRWLGSKNYVYDDPRSTWVRDDLYYFPTGTIANLLHRLYDFKDFEEAVNKYYSENHTTWVNNMLGTATALQTELKHDAILDGIKWNRFRTKNASTVEQKRNSEFDKLRSFISARDAFLTEYYTQDHSVAVKKADTRTFIEKIADILKALIKSIVNTIKNSGFFNRETETQTQIESTVTPTETTVPSEYSSEIQSTEQSTEAETTEQSTEAETTEQSTEAEPSEQTTEAETSEQTTEAEPTEQTTEAETQAQTTENPTMTEQPEVSE